MEPKLLDFGISKSSGQDKMRLTNSKGLLMGTPFYMSPEASQGLEMTGLSDQYALGVVLYEAATGANPFSGASTFGEVVRQVTTGDYPPVATRNPKLSKRMIAIIERAMHLDPHRRFPDMRAMGRELLGLAGQRTRITWGLSFSEISQASGLETVGAPLPAVLPRRESQRPAPSGRKNRYLVPIALEALAAAGAVWMNRPKPEGQVVAINNQPPAADGPTSRVLDLRGPTTSDDKLDPPNTAPPSPAEEPVADRTARGLGDPIGEARGEPASEEAAPPPAKPEEKALIARNSHVPQASNPSPRSRAVRGNGRRTLVTRPAAPTSVAAPAAAATESVPDWLMSQRQNGSANRGPDRGTNNAPILD